MSELQKEILNDFDKIIIDIEELKKCLSRYILLLDEKPE